jgi:hypothetical protein
LFPESLKLIVTVELATPFERTGPVPVMLEFAETAAPAVKVTVPPAFETGDKIDRVFTSALSELRVQVETPLVSVAVQAL